jgi:transposase-like protein
MIPKEVIRELIKESNFKSTTDIMEAIKGMFKDVLQEVMEAELDTQLGYNKQERRMREMADFDENGVSKNYRNGYSKKTVKTQLGEVEINVPRDRNGEYEPKIIEKYQRNADGMEEKVLALYAAVCQLGYFRANQESL